MSGSCSQDILPTQLRTEDFDNEELISQFRQNTGESAADCLKMVEKVINKRNLVCLLHDAIIYANEVGQPGEQQTKTMEGNFPTRRSIYDKLMYSCIVGNFAFRKWKVTYWVGFFIIPEATQVFFSFMLKVLFPVTIFSNLNVLQLKMIIRQWV